MWVDSPLFVKHLQVVLNCSIGWHNGHFFRANGGPDPRAKSFEAWGQEELGDLKAHHLVNEPS